MAARLALIDEYRLFVHPVVSPGAPWFDQIEGRHGMRLISATPHQNGVVGLYYKPSDPNETLSGAMVGRPACTAAVKAVDEI